MEGEDDLGQLPRPLTFTAPTSTTTSSTTSSPDSITTTSTSDAVARVSNAFMGLSNIGIRPPRVFDNKKENDFRSWVMRLERFMALANIPADRYTSILLLHLGSEPFATSRYLGLKDDLDYKEARTRLIQHYSPQEEPVELRSRFQMRMQEGNESLENYARELRVLAARAFPKATADMLDTLMVQQFVLGIRDVETKTRLILKKCTTLQEALNAARLSEIADKTGRSKRIGGILAVGETATSQWTGPRANYSSHRGPGRGIQNKQNNWNQPSRSSTMSKPGYQQTGTNQYSPRGRGMGAFRRRDGQQTQFVGVCFRCNRPGHIARFCTWNQNSNSCHVNAVQQNETSQGAEQWENEQSPTSSHDSSRSQQAFNQGMVLLLL